MIFDATSAATVRSIVVQKTRWKCSASVQIISGLQLLYMATLKLHTKKTGAILEGGFHAAKIRELYRKICLHQTVKFFYVKLMDIPLPVARDVGRTLSSAWFVSRCITVTLWPSSTSPLTIHAAAILPWFSMLQVSLKMSQLHYCLDWLPGTQKVSTFFCAQNKLNFVNVNHLVALHGSFSMWFRFPKAILKQTLCLWSSGQGRTQSCLAA